MIIFTLGRDGSSLPESGLLLLSSAVFSLGLISTSEYNVGMLEMIRHVMLLHAIEFRVLAKVSALCVFHVQIIF